MTTLGQSPLLSASVFNFFSPFYATRCHRAGRAGRTEFQNASDTRWWAAPIFSRMISDGGLVLTT